MPATSKKNTNTKYNDAANGTAEDQLEAERVHTDPTPNDSISCDHSLSPLAKAKLNNSLEFSKHLNKMHSVIKSS